MERGRDRLGGRGLDMLRKQSGSREADDAPGAHDEGGALVAAETVAANKPAILEWYERAAARVRLGLDPFRSD